MIKRALAGAVTLATLLATTAVAGIGAVPALALDGHAASTTGVESGEGVGTQYMVFETGVEGAAHESFLRGLALLHNFEYSRAAAAFRKAQAADPDWLMPYWGEAMTHNHPLWEEQDRDAAKAILAKLGATAQARRAKARSAREAEWLDAVETLYGDGATKEERDHLYLAKMRALHAANPNDIDARAFTGLAVLGTSHGGRDIALYMEAAGVLEPGFITHKQHPGILHYLIHSYDDPVHATLGERMAERYASVAPDAGHAQHMVSHIFHALGDWEASEDANVKAVAAANRARNARGAGPYHCGHYNEWLVYARAQQGEDASALVEACRGQAAQELASDRRPSTTIAPGSAATSFARIALYAGVTSGDWAETLDWPKPQFLKAQFHMANARLLQSRDDLIAATATLAEMKRLRAAILDAQPEELPNDTGLAPWTARAVAQGEAIVLIDSGDFDGGIDALANAAEAEAALPVVFGPPIIAKPSYELLGEELLKADRYGAAAEAFRKSLAFAPGRKLSLEGLAEALKRAG